MAKHWKAFIKKEPVVSVPTTIEEEEKQSLADLLKSDNRQQQKSLDAVAGSNINLKALMDEQKKLTAQMDALTGKSETNPKTTRQYDNEIKSFDQKRREIQEDEDRRKKALQKRKNKNKETDRWLVKQQKQLKVAQNNTRLARKKDTLSLPKRKSAAINKPSGLIQKTVRKNAKASSIPSKKKEHLDTTKRNLNIDKTLAFGKEISTTLKRAKTNTKEKTSTKLPIKNIEKGIKSGMKKGAAISKKIDALETSVTKKRTTFSSIIKPAKEVKKANDQISNFTKKLDSSFMQAQEKLKSVAPTKGGAKSISYAPIFKQKNELEIPQKNGINKVDNFFNHTNSYLDKTAIAKKHFTTILSKSDAIKQVFDKEEVAFGMRSVDQIFTKKEAQTKGFNTNNQPFNISLSNITNAKKQLEELPNKKTASANNNRFSL